MMNPENFFKIQFSDPLLSDERLVKSAQIHVSRFKKNNPAGKYTPLITATETKTDALANTISDKGFMHSEREGSTKTVDQYLADFISLAKKSEKLISYTFGEGSAEYQAFYPHGTKQYTNVNKTNALDLMKNISKASVKYAAKLNPDFVKSFGDILINYTAAREAQQGKVGEIAGKQNEKDGSRVALELQLQTNLLTLALDFMGQPERCSTYFELSLFKPYRHKSRTKTDAGTTDGESDAYVLAVPAHSTAKAEFTLTSGENLVLYNAGENMLSVYAALNDTDPLPANAITIAAGDEKTVAVADLGPAGSKYLLVNNATSAAGSIEISLI